MTTTVPNKPADDEVNALYTPDMPSSVVKHIEYNEDSNTLKITFQTGAVYTYYEVPASVHIGLRQARSKGRYFNKYISGQFPFQRL
ncbi:KTSC domain-containing protein [Parapedobacter sp. DT-150]|uniref:KTSC domain-containing protein n=1 Tax=Parapedobacter sp. DT-150 TaxID=3396162 RepID=UPI003F19CEE3